MNLEDTDKAPGAVNVSGDRSPYWPVNLSGHLPLPATNLFLNAEVSAARYPDKPYLVYYDTPVTFSEFKDEAEKIAGYLQCECGVQAGDRVLLYMQNSPQWMIAYYGILRANAVVVPVNPMNLTEELRHYVEDSCARVIFLAQELYERARPLIEGPQGQTLAHAIVVTYSDYLKCPTDLAPPEFVVAPRHVSGPHLSHWADALADACVPRPLTAGSDDPCVMPYTSGTTGQPKGCVHTHRSTMATTVSGVAWFGTTPDAVGLSVLPMFHVAGMQGGNSSLYCGNTVVLLPRWDRDAAARAIERYRVTGWPSISTMVVDFLANPRLPEYDLSSLKSMRGGGAAMPDAVVKKLHEITGLEFVEGYGLSETIAATHINPPHRPKRQCLGIPIFDVDARIIDPETLAELPQGEVGEIIVHGPQLMREYWRNPEATCNAFIERDGKRFLRTGDLGRIDEDGYFFMADRLKRMINASGFKIWPAEVEALMYRHPAIKEVCVIGIRDGKRGETAKAFVVLNEDHSGMASESEIIKWAQDNMAAYKVPRVIEFMAALPKSGAGKIMWRELQERERATGARA